MRIATHFNGRTSPAMGHMLVGAGPGDPGLLTLREAELLAAAEALKPELGNNVQSSPESRWTLSLVEATW